MFKSDCRQTISVAGGTYFTGAFRRIKNIVKSDCWPHNVSMCLSAWNNSAPTGRTFMKFNI